MSYAYGAGVEDSASGGLKSWSTRFGLVTTSVTAVSGTSRAVTTTNPDGSTAVQTYANGLLSSETRADASGGTLGGVTYQYDGFARVAGATDARNGQTVYAYYDNDAVRSVTTPPADANTPAQTTLYTYDQLGRKASDTLPDGGIVSYHYFPTRKISRGQAASIDRL